MIITKLISLSSKRFFCALVCRVKLMRWSVIIINKSRWRLNITHTAEELRSCTKINSDVFVVVDVDRFDIASFSALEQAHCTRV